MQKLLELIEEEAQKKYQEKSKELVALESQLNQQKKEQTEKAQSLKEREEYVESLEEGANERIDVALTELERVKEEVRDLLVDKESLETYIGARKKDMETREKKVETRWEAIMLKEQDLIKQSKELTAKEKALKQDERLLGMVK